MRTRSRRLTSCSSPASDSRCHPLAAAAFETLESRRMLSASIVNGQLRVVGTADNEIISVSAGSVNGVAQFLVEQRLASSMGSTLLSFDAARVTNGIVIEGKDGNDRIEIERSITRRTTLSSGNGNDTLIGGFGKDTLRGGAGFDLLDGRGNADRFEGGADVDTADYSTRSLDVFVSLDNVANDGSPFKGGELDNVRTDVENVIGGDGPDTITGSAAANNLAGRGGNDTINGGPGGFDYLTGGDGADRLTAAPGTAGALLSGNAGNDTLIGSDGHDQLFGGADNDDLYAGAGNDSLYGEAGFDYMDGGTGADHISGGAGGSVLTYSSRTEPLFITIDGAANDGGASDWVNGKGDYVSSDVGVILGGQANDYMWGGNENNQFHGNGGNDNLYGNGGLDALYGGAGDDNIQGGDGSDIVDGGAGADYLVGGAANDTIRISPGGIDRYFSDAFDQLVVSAV